MRIFCDPVNQNGFMGYVLNGRICFPRGGCWGLETEELCGSGRGAALPTAAGWRVDTVISISIARLDCDASWFVGRIVWLGTVLRRRAGSIVCG